MSASQPLTLNAIKTAPISKGGYAITFAGKVPVGARVHLCLENATNRLEITGGYGANKLPDLLKLIGVVDGWGKTIRCWVVLEQMGKFVGESSAQDMACPVKPYDGLITFDGFAVANPPLTYPGNGKGRTLTQAIDGKYYFRNGSILETDNAMRGFDCTTFPMALFNCYPSMAGKYGTALADALGAVKCEMEQKKESDVKSFFKGSGSGGLYFMWSAGHVVLVKGAIIHEFTYGGYRRTAVDVWTGFRFAPQGLWWIRKLPDTLTP